LRIIAGEMCHCGLKTVDYLIFQKYINENLHYLKKTMLGIEKRHIVEKIIVFLVLIRN